jgi:ABC-2 type transport system permease protein
MAVKELIEARWKLIIGGMVMLVAAVAFAAAYELFIGLLTGPVAQQAGPFQSQLDALVRGGYDVYIWSQWFSKTAPQILVILAAILGAGLIAGEVNKGTIFFLLSKPVSRTRVLLTKYGVSALVLLGVTLLSSAAILVAAAVRGQPVHWAGVAVSSLLLWVGMLFPLGLALLCSILYKDIWLPLVIAILVTVVLSVVGFVPGWGEWNLTGYWADYSAYLGNTFPLKALIILLVAAALPVAAAIPLFRKQQY